MDKEEFLRLQYLRMINSDEFVVELWRSSLDRFITDLWDRTPATPGRRFLTPVDPALGFSPDNVEWQYPKVKSKRGNKQSAKSGPAKPSPMVVSRAESKRIEANSRAALVQEKRKAIAEQYLQWEQQRQRN